MTRMSSLLIPIVMLLLVLPASSQSETDPLAIEDHLRQFFDEYLGVYNRRFGNPEGDESYKEEILQYVHLPVVMFPPNNAPGVLNEHEVIQKNFLGFTKNLDKQGVRSLEWKDVRIHVLTPTKALANNYAHGIDEEGNVVYETVSVYLIYKTDEGWRIQTFNPYNISAGMVAASF